MNLEEKFIDVIYNNQTASEIKKGCIQICDEFVVGFSDWKDKKYWYSRDKKCYVKYGMPNSIYTTTELLEIYKQGL